MNSKFVPNRLVSGFSDFYNEYPNIAFSDKQVKVLNELGFKYSFIPVGCPTYVKGRRGVKDTSICSQLHSIGVVDAGFSTERIATEYKVFENVFNVVREYTYKKIENYNGFLFAITGSVGKTTTKKLLATALSAYGTVNSLGGNVPLRLRRQVLSLNDEDFCVLEISVKALESSLSDISTNVAILTSISDGHVGRYSGVDEIVDIKSKIFSLLKPGGVAVINYDCQFYEKILKIADEYAGRVITYSLDGNSDADIKLLEYDDVSTVRVCCAGTEYQYSLSVKGLHNVANSFAVIGSLMALNYPLEKGLSAMFEFEGVDGRGRGSFESIDGKSFFLIDDSYNANPLSMKASLESFIKLEREGRKVVVLGDMLELGSASKKHHQDLLNIVDTSRLDEVVLVGSEMKHLWDILPSSKKIVWVESYKKVYKYLRNCLMSGDAVLFKSSNSTGLNKVVARIKKS